MDDLPITAIPADGKCWFLERLSLELRLKIYEYLVAPRKELRLSKARGYRNSHPVGGKFSLSILEVSRQIYHEASPIFYTSVTLIVQIADLEYIDPKPDLNMMYPPLNCPTELERAPVDIDTTSLVWRYCPWQYFVSRYEPREVGQYPYDEKSWIEWDGIFDPHVFARFQNIRVVMERKELYAYFGKEFLMARYITDLKHYFQESRLLRVLTTLLSGVLVLKYLEIVLDVNGAPEEWNMLGTFPRDPKECIKREQLPSDEIIQSGSNGFQFSLGKLKNVQAFEVKIVPFPNMPPKGYELGNISGKVVKELKEELAARVSGRPVALSKMEITRQVVEARGRSINLHNFQLETIKDINVTPGMEKVLLEMLELQIAHQEKMVKLSCQIDDDFEDMIQKRTYVWGSGRREL